MADINIAGTLHNTEDIQGDPLHSHVAVRADEILDEAKGKKQSQINTDTETTLDTHETRLNAYTEGKFVTVDTYSALPDTGAVDTVYRVSSWDGTANSGNGAVDVTKYSEYAWQNGAYKFLDVKTQIGEVFDISEYNNDTYDDLSDALGTNGANVPEALRKGGMSVKFVCTSDDKYVQYRLMATTWSTTISDWQGVDKNLAIGSHNLIESGTVAEALSKVSNEIIVNDDQTIMITTDDGTDTLLKITENEVDAKNLKSNGKDVATEDELDLKQDIIPEISQEEYEDESEECIILADNNGEEIQKIKAETLQEDNSVGFILASDDYDGNNGEIYAKINSNGMFLKKLFNIDGTPFFADFLSGKKWAVFGDSFTKGDNINAVIEEGKYAGENASYPWIIGNRTGINVLKFFENGRTLAFPAQPGDFVNSVTNPTQSYYYQNIPADVDYITFYLGINDSHHASNSSGGDGEDNTGVIPIGTISDNTTSTYYGAWNVVLSWLIENRPFAHIGIIVSNGCDSVNYRNAQIAVANKYGIPYIDLNGDDRTPFMLRTTNPDIPSSIKNIRIQKQAINPSSNTHPNAAAYKFESTFIENFLRSI